ncbi:hypothetical protein J7E79_06335 [Bacillus sp. ISL-40]|uniref:hypothetical protein n=1 Tax=Bacillus sp. ISL-40 TaxID=2819126 RepID=UPI001BE86814|nr:hypothetical protein [Bacillus sp. ISL-40]MBT2697028.1 hypothetical protein [Bacillus sp. ISL-40]
MKLLEQLTTVDEMVQALKDNSDYYNCSLTGFEVHKDSYLNFTNNDVCVSWWDYRGCQKPCDVIVRCSSEEEQEAVYSKWWQAIEMAGGRTRKAYEEEKAFAKGNREWAKEHEKRISSGEINNDWMAALGI